MELQALLFDVDGTLADTEEAHRMAFNAAFKEFGYDWEWDRAMYKTLLRTTGGKERLKDYWDNEIGFVPPEDKDELAKKIHKRKTAFYGEMMLSGQVPLRPGVARLIKEAQEAGLRLAIATTTTPANVETLFAGTIGKEVLDQFEVMGAGDVVPAKKPAPDIYTYVLDELGLPAEACLALEDSSNGIRSATAAGLKSVITVSFYTSDEKFPGAAAILSNFGEPDAPFEVLEGDAYGKTCVDIDLLKRWHAEG